MCRATTARASTKAVHIDANANEVTKAHFVIVRRILVQRSFATTEAFAIEMNTNNPSVNVRRVTEERIATKSRRVKAVQALSTSDVLLFGMSLENLCVRLIFFLLQTPVLLMMITPVSMSIATMDSV